MADLLPSMSSDEEDNLLDDPEDDEGVEVNKDFVFGGILVSWWRCRLDVLFCDWVCS